MEPKRIDNRRDILLLLLYAPGVHDEINEPIVGRTRLVKMLFLFKTEALQHFRSGTEINEQNFYDFFAWNFGPFSSQVYDDLTFFSLRGFIEAQETTEDALPESAEEWHRWLTSSTPDNEDDSFVSYEEQQFRLTEKGMKFAEQLYDRLNHAQRKLLREFKGHLNGTPLRAILRYVYKNYPDQIERSQIKEQVLGRRGH
jgi:hypothetical protein